MLFLRASFWEYLVDPTVVTILLLIGFVGLLVELIAPGHVIPGLIGFAAFAFYFLAHYYEGISGLDAPFIFLCGLVLVIFEWFIPGGVFGIIGLLMVGYAIVISASSIQVGLIALLISLVGTALVLWILFKFFGLRFKNSFILRAKQDNQEGYTSSKVRNHLLGKEGIAVTPLRPAGVALIDGKREDVVSQGEFIPKDSKIKVVKVEGMRVVVEKEEESS